MNANGMLTSKRTRGQTRTKSTGVSRGTDAIKFGVGFSRTQYPQYI